jgi:hypothetical protein
MDSDYQVATEVRMYGCNLNLMKLLLNETLDKVGASMYGNESSSSGAPTRPANRRGESGKSALKQAA